MAVADVNSEVHGGAAAIVWSGPAHKVKIRPKIIKRSPGSRLIKMPIMDPKILNDFSWLDSRRDYANLVRKKGWGNAHRRNVGPRPLGRYTTVVTVQALKPYTII